MSVWKLIVKLFIDEYQQRVSRDFYYLKSTRATHLRIVLFYHTRYGKILYLHFTCFISLNNRSYFIFSTIGLIVTIENLLVISFVIVFTIDHFLRLKSRGLNSLNIGRFKFYYKLAKDIVLLMMWFKLPVLFKFQK